MSSPGGHKDYSATPLPKKLGIREGSRVLVLGAPTGFGLGPLPSGVELASRARGPLDVVWPKRAVNVPTDLTFEIVQGVGLAAGLVDNKSASIDDVFHGEQFVVRVKDRPKAG